MSTHGMSAIETRIEQCQKDIPTLCTQCQSDILVLSALGQWQRVFDCFLIKQLDGTVILNADDNITSFDLTINDLLSQIH